MLTSHGQQMAAAVSQKAAQPAVQHGSKYRPEIDGLRAFAVVAVIINHFNKDLLPSGYLGVDIFFVISGYVITSSLANRKSKNFVDFLTGFYERRIKRLLPALITFVLITSLMITLFNPDPRVALNLGLRSLFGISNITLFRSSTDYFAQATELNPFTHTWSLGVEEQFYLLFPFLAWFSGFSQKTAKGTRNLWLCVAVLTIASLASFISLYSSNQPAAYFLMPPRFWEMAMGCLIFITFQKRAKIEEKLRQIPPQLVIATMIGVMFLPTERAVPATVAMVLLSAVLIACLRRGTFAFLVFTNNKVVYIGLISYSLYLWHWGVLCISRWTIGISLWSAPFQVGAILLLAILSYQYIESTARKSAMIMPPKFVILAGLVSLILASLLIKVIRANHREIFQAANPQGKWIETRSPNGRTHKTWSLADNRAGTTRDELSAKQTAAGCLIVDRVSSQDLQNCLGINGRIDDQRSKIYVIGDSHANAYSPGIRSAFPNHDTRTYTVGWGCSYLPHSTAVKNGKAKNFVPVRGGG